MFSDFDIQTRQMLTGNLPDDWLLCLLPGMVADCV